MPKIKTKVVNPVVIDHDKGEVLVLGVPQHFAPKPYNLLRTLLLAKGKIVTREAILNALYDNPEDVDDRSVDQHVCRIRKALGKVSPFLKTVGERGYRWVTP